MTAPIRDQIDLLVSLKLPDRFEPLFNRVGHELSRILVAPGPEIAESLQTIVDQIRFSEQGAFIPLAGPSGAGKTTFAREVTQWFSRDFTPTVNFEGEVTYRDLKEAVDTAVANLPSNNTRIVPINIDHRESAPPSDTELSEIKRFLRTSPSGCRNVIFWPEIDDAIASDLGKRYMARAGTQPIPVLRVAGPPREAWQETAIATLRLSNGMEDLENIGVNPKTYDPHEYPSIGEFLRQIHADFNKLLRDLRSQISKAVVLVIVYISESDEPGVLNFQTSSSRHGRLDSSGLLKSTPDSVIGKWWAAREGLLIRTIVQCNAHALFLPPAVSMSALRNLASADDAVISKLGVARVGPSKAINDLKRSDLLKLLLGEKLDRFEGRGNPAATSVAGFRALASSGINLAKDKRLNAILAEGIRPIVATQDPAPVVTVEKALDTLKGLIPDTAVSYADVAFCIEYVWRSGEALSSSHRSEVAQYILNKLRNYARALGFTQD